ncbi:MAG TPA: hypothetical protein VLC09_09740 [Polyangiaceae bacterium]|nr:hypothetical protein [Polyangiaceae bacterium]
MFYVFLLIVAAVGAAVYLTVFMSQVPGAKEERFGKLEPLPEHLGSWVRDERPDAAGRVRETRHLLEEKHGLGSSQLVLQVRYRDPATDEIVHVEPEQFVQRRRIRA